MLECDFLKLAGNSRLVERGIFSYSLDSVDSTNSYARRQAVVGNIHTPILIIANSQTQGRGRMGRSFFSPQDTGIYMTVVIDVTDDEPSSMIRLTSLAAVATRHAIFNVTGKAVGIKWVNDLYLDGKKVCGILAESFSAQDRRYAMVGVGINLSTRTFPKELCSVAGSLKVENFLRRQLVLDACCEIFDLYQQVRGGSIDYMEEYRQSSVVLGKQVVFSAEGKVDTGIAVSIGDDGALDILKDNGQRISLCTGEITLRIREVEK